MPAFTTPTKINNTHFQTTKLKEKRAEARQMAVAAAREKAEIYCQAAGVALGQVLHIEDVNPDSLRGRGEGHMRQEPTPDFDDGLQVFNPNSIVVGAAVMISFALIEGAV